MNKKKTELGFIHRFMPPKHDESGANAAATRTSRRETQRKTFTTFLLLYGTGGNEQDLIPLAYELDKSAVILSPRGKVLENGITPRFFRRLAEGVFDLEEKLFGLFKNAGAKVSLSWQESGHELTMDEIRNAKEWLRMHSASSSRSSFA